MDIEAYAEFSPHLYSDDVPEMLLGLLDQGSWRSLADFGCGDGALLYALKRRGYFHDGRKFTGVELSKNRAAVAQSIDPAFAVINSSVVSVPQIVTGSLDRVISTQVIEHVDDADFLREISRVLAPGGKVYLSTVFKTSYAWYFYRNPSGEWVLDPTHLREYRREEELLAKVRAAGLKCVAQNKILFKFPLSDLVLKKFIALTGRRTLYQNPVLNWFRQNVKVPIIGFYNWEMVLERDN